MRKFLPYILIILVLTAGVFSYPATSGAQQCTASNGQPGELVDGGDGKLICVAGVDTKASTGAGNEDLYSKLPKCEITTSEGWSGCIIVAFYWLVYALPMGILAIVAYFFNAMLAVTLSSNMYGSSFISEGWRIVRDFSNIFFILVLLYTSIRIILGLGGAEVKKTIATVVVAALLINFSMFMTKVVIDASNILALIFHSKLDAVTKNSKGEEIAYNPATDPGKTGVKDTNISGGIVSAFDPGNWLGNTLTDAKNQQPTGATGTPLPGGGTTATYYTTTNGLLLAAGPVGWIFIRPSDAGYNIGPYLMVIATGAAIAIFASYALFIAAIAFLGRLIELWLLIIFAPFAFMSLSIPQLAKIKYLGWNEWLHRLLSLAFMAPIFMFMLLLISKFVKAPLDIAAKQNVNFVGNIILLVIPGLIILVLLHKATKFAKEGSGEFAAAFIKYGQMAAGVVGGLAIGAASGGVGLAATATLGRAGAAIANSASLKRREAAGGIDGFLMGKLRDLGKFSSKSSFDLRKAPGFSTLAKSAGLRNVESTKAIGLGVKEGGWEKTRADQVKKHQERAKELEVGEDEELKQNLNNLQRDQQELLRAASHPIELLDRQIKGAVEASNAAAAVLRAAVPGTQAHADAQINASDAANRVTHLRTLKSNIKNASGTQQNMNELNAIVTTAEAQLNLAQQGGDQRRIIAAQQQLDAANAAVEVAQIAAGMGNRSINHFEDVAIPHAHHAIEVENRDRKWAYANNISSTSSRVLNSIFRAGNYSMYRGVNEAAHKIRMEVKLDAGKDGGH